MMMALLFVPPAWSGEQQHDNPDPWEGFNRKVFVFNDTFDRYLLKPLARGYMVVMPDWADRGLYNFFGNLTEPRVIVNGLLQGKFRQAGINIEISSKGSQAISGMAIMRRHRWPNTSSLMCERRSS